MMTAVQPIKTSVSKDGRTATVSIPVTFLQRGGRKQILTPAGTAPWSPTPRVDTTLVKAVVRAHRWRQMLESGEYASSAELAKAEKVNDSYLSRILRLDAPIPHHEQRPLDLIIQVLPLCWQFAERAWNLMQVTVATSWAR